VTYTNETVGGLSTMGLNSSWDDSAQANEHVPPLAKGFPYGKQPIRGVSLGGWLSVEPFVTPSFFSRYSVRDNIVDEYTLSSRLGTGAAQFLEQHYATFITEQSFKEIRDAGLDHVRIPYPYWAVKTYDGDPYVAKISWRYLLRGVEYCRKYGLRVSLDLHSLPGSQNGWNHSGRQGPIGWLNGPDGGLNSQRSLDIHDQLSQFFAQPRYKNVVTIYGLVNEPMMLTLDTAAVLDWTTKAISIVRRNGMDQLIAFSDGFLILSRWATMLQGVDDHLLLDTHQYTIFNTAQVGLKHAEKVELVCRGWVSLISDSNTKVKG
jgi:glucan 1,3-beta-glucosidase